MNQMKQVAKMFGVELNEEFMIKNSAVFHGNGYVYKSKRMFTEEGLKYQRLDTNTWEFDEDAELTSLLTGVLEVVKKPWKPRRGEPYFYIAGNPLYVMCGTSIDSMMNRMLFRLGNCYPTKEAAEADREKWERFFVSDERIEWEDANDKGN